MNQTTTPLPESSVEFPAIGFRVASETYGLRLADVLELISVPRITRVPKAPGHVAGVINLHGNVVPVFDLAERFAIGHTELGPSAKVVVVDCRGETVGILAENVSRVTRFASDQVQPPPASVSEIGPEFIEGVVRLEDKFIILLNIVASLGNVDSKGNGAEDEPGR